MKTKPLQKMECSEMLTYSHDLRMEQIILYKQVEMFTKRSLKNLKTKKKVYYDGNFRNT